MTCDKFTVRPSLYVPNMKIPITREQCIIDKLEEYITTPSEQT